QTRLRYIALNKPPGFVASMSDERNRPIAATLLGSAVEERVYNVGRLDQWSSGLLLFTNDGDLAALMVHPSGRIDKEYEVVTDRPIPPEFVPEFLSGVEVEGIVYKAESANILSENTMRIVLGEGKNREIRRVLEHYNLRALALRRIRIGPIEIGNLEEGKFRELQDEEVAALRAFSERRKREGRVM
ncbi:MAG TPA: pseudouridine synthase, partial [Rectinemataceae bacterium]|nr:pseudouridine synthase [Rectinemataceae bacterium]